MSMKLYYIPTTRAVRPRWLLEEMELSYELVQVNSALMRQPDYRQLHPHAKVPVLIDGEVTLYESAAICAYLADRYPEKQCAPDPQSPERGSYYQWLFYAMVTLEPPVEQYMFNKLPQLPEGLLPSEKRSSLPAPEALRWFEKVCEPLEGALQNQAYLVGDRLTAADVVAGGVLMWALRLGMMQRPSPVRNYIERLMARPAFLRADDDFYAKIEPPSEFSP
jgi:glutathione S-transferase